MAPEAQNTHDSGMDEAKKYLSEQEVLDFARKNTVRINRNRANCGDGRYKPGESEGGIRVFGADFGILAAFVGAALKEGKKLSSDDLKKTVEQYRSTIKMLRGVDAEPEYHGDNHPMKNGIPNCGHIGNLLSGPDGDVMGELLTSFMSGPTKATILEGEHKERAVVDINDMNLTIHSFNPESDTQVFVTQSPLSTELITRVAPYLVLVEPDKAVATLREQTLSTAIKLAPNMPMYSISFTPEGSPSVTSAGRVPMAA